MKLEAYLRKEKITPIEFAVRIGVGLTTVYRYLGGQNPNLSIAFRIEKETKGQVTFEDFGVKND